jgi:hypothetical protein
MDSFHRHYPEWKAPSEDASLLVWPGPRELVDDAIANHALLSRADGTRVQNMPLAELRKRMRQFIGHEDERPLIATGHQVELHHPGVWVKKILINLLAEKTQGAAFHVAIDTDSPKHLTLRWPSPLPSPGVPGEGVRGAVSGAPVEAISLPVTDDPNLTKAAWTGLLDPPTPAHLQQIAGRLRSAEHGWGFKPELEDVLLSLRRLSLESLNLPSALANAMHELDWSLGLRHHLLVSSPIWTCEPHLVFAHDLIARADQVASHYNAALQSYRDEHGITTQSRPMPDLLTSDEAAEIPFWLDDLHTGKRIRPSIFRGDRGWILELVSGDEFVFDPTLGPDEASARLYKWLMQTRHRITPRAMTNMLFLRLLLVDQFIHGIGGGRYDQVTDRFIASFYQIEPPKFGVTTATMYFPAAIGRQRVCVPCVRQEGHRLKHAILGQRKRELVAQIASLPRRSSERASRYYEMHRELSRAASENPALQRWQAKLQQTQEQEKQDETLFDRELFYAMQPRERLEQMIERYHSEIDGN